MAFRPLLYAVAVPQHGYMPTTTTQLTLRTGRLTPPSPALTLTAALLGFALITLDASVVNVALPSIGHTLGGDRKSVV